MPEPGLQLEQRERLFGIEQLRGNGCSGAVAGDGAASVGFRDTGFVAEDRDQGLVHVRLPDPLATMREQTGHQLACRSVHHQWLFVPYGCPGRYRFSDEPVYRFGKGRPCLVRWNIKETNWPAGACVRPRFLPPNAANSQPAQLVIAQSGE